MPLKIGLKHHGPPEAEQYTSRLLAEIKDPQAEGQPLIIIEPNIESPSHVYVIWDEWAALSQSERSEIIADVIYKLYGDGVKVKNPANLTVAMGLTSAEAKRMGIESR